MAAGSLLVTVVGLVAVPQCLTLKGGAVANPSVPHTFVRV